MRRINTQYSESIYREEAIFMDDPTARVQRINELARKKRTVGLTDEEQTEQQQLRAAYLKDFRNGMERMLESIVVEEQDGSTHPLRKIQPK